MYFMRLASYTLVAVAAAIVPASAQQNFGHAFVSGIGTDSGVCNRLAPCRTFAYAVNQVPAGGQIFAIDTADYGPVTIAKTLTIAAADGVTAISNGVTIGAGANDVVNLRGLDIEGLQNGIEIDSGNVNLEHSTINGGATGIVVASAGRTTVSDTTITGSSTFGIIDQTSGSTVVLDRVSLSGTGTIAIRMDNSSLTMTDSTIVGWSYGLYVTSSAFVKRSVIAGSSTYGIFDLGTLYLDTTTITGCGTGVTATGPFNSYGNNNIVGNGTNITGAKTTVQPQAVRSGAHGPAR